MSGWEIVHRSHDRTSRRMAVPGGWLYLVTEHHDNGYSILNQMMAFVPNPRAGTKAAAKKAVRAESGGKPAAPAD